MPTTEVEGAIKTLNDLMDQREQLVARATKLASDRQACAYAAHTGDAKAKERLRKINDEAILHSSELEGVDAAIAEATSRVAAANAAEALAADRAQAERLDDELEVFVQCGAKIDAALAVIIEAGNLMEQTLHRMNALTTAAPNNGQLTTLGALALHSSLMFTPWRREFRHLAPGERQSFAHLIERWDSRITADIAARLGEQEEAA